MSKVKIQKSLSELNSIEVTIKNESHTVAAPLVERLNADPNCVFAAYKIEHPMNDYVNIRLAGNDFKNANTILEDAIKSIITDIDDLITQIRSNE